jgi:hypothetical protein
VALPCDALLPGARLVLHRAVGVAAPAPLGRALMQLHRS